MIIAVLIVFGLCLGSFVNALVWRLHEQDDVGAGHKRPSKKYRQQLSITKGRSMCPHCKHQLAAADLLPVVSWVSLGGKCRYCHKPISLQYPLVELLMAGLFVACYVWWPQTLQGAQVVIFGLWLVLLVGLLALLIYDLRWMLLPNRLMYPLSVIAAVQSVISITTSDRPVRALIGVVLAVAIGGGIFYVLFQLSKGKWIGGGDVKLGWLLGLIVGTPGGSLLLIFLAAIGGSLVSVPLLAAGRLRRSSVIPFGPFLIAAAIVVCLFGQSILDWYQHTLLQLN